MSRQPPGLAVRRGDLGGRRRPATPTVTAAAGRAPPAASSVADGQRVVARHDAATTAPVVLAGQAVQRLREPGRPTRAARCRSTPSARGHGDDERRPSRSRRAGAGRARAAAPRRRRAGEQVVSSSPRDALLGLGDRAREQQHQRGDQGAALQRALLGAGTSGGARATTSVPRCSLPASAATATYAAGASSTRAPGRRRASATASRQVVQAASPARPAAPPGVEHRHAPREQVAEHRGDLVDAAAVQQQVGEPVVRRRAADSTARACAR